MRLSGSLIFGHRMLYDQVMEIYGQSDLRARGEVALWATDAFTHRLLYTQTLLKTKPVTHRRFYRPTLLQDIPTRNDALKSQ